jgi:hypothetical protein
MPPDQKAALIIAYVLAIPLAALAYYVTNAALAPF